MASYISLVLMKCKQKSDVSLTAFMYKLGELSVHSCCRTAKQCRYKLEIDLLSSQLANENITRCVIKKHCLNGDPYINSNSTIQLITYYIFKHLRPKLNVLIVETIIQ